MEVEETLENILKESLQVWLVRESPRSQSNLPLTQMGYPQSTGEHYIDNQIQTKLLELKKIKI